MAEAISADAAAGGFGAGGWGGLFGNLGTALGFGGGGCVFAGANIAVNTIVAAGITAPAIIGLVITALTALPKRPAGTHENFTDRIALLNQNNLIVNAIVTGIISNITAAALLNRTDLTIANTILKQLPSEQAAQIITHMSIQAVFNIIEQMHPQNAADNVLLSLLDGATTIINLESEFIHHIFYQNNYYFLDVDTIEMLYH